MSGGKFNFTPEQKAAIEHTGTLLVSAAAGSGKTRVLVSRLLRRITKDGCDIDRFLVITYSKAAAAELRERIMEEISDRLAEEPRNRRLKRQSILCSTAQISTIHSFCSGLLRRYAHATSVNPDFKVADVSDCDVIKAEVLEEVLDDAYKTINENDGLKALVQAMSAGWDDRKLYNIIIDTHNSLQSNPRPELWARMQSGRLSFGGINDVSETVWGSYLIESAQKAARFWHEEMCAHRDELRSHEKADRAYGESLDGTIGGLAAFIKALDMGWDAAVSCGEIPFPRPKPISGFEEMKALRTRCKDSMKKITALFECKSAELLEDMETVAPAVRELLRLVTVFGDAYKEEKARRSIVDFSDLEHLTLELLINIETGERTQAACEIAREFEEVMVDEYQDVNAVQELIFNAVSKDGKNIFMVGDVKQSIYRFRLADPSIFMRNYNTFRDKSDADGTKEGTRILLSQNFRSRAAVLEAVNYIFKGIMSKDFGEMDYTERECLVPGRAETTGEGEAVFELDVIDLKDIEQAGDEENAEKTDVEAAFVAERIYGLAGNYMIPDGKGGGRAAEYSDIVILMRSLKNKARRYAAALSERGIPVETPDGEDFFQTLEISAAVSLLEIIDNPRQDIPLAAVMRCPIYNFTADELAAVRGAEKDADFYTALCTAAEGDEKCAKFLLEIGSLREIAPDMTVSRFIWHVYNTTELKAVFGAMKGGEQRRANLMLLLKLSEKFDDGRGLFGFLTYIRALRDKGIKYSPEGEAVGINAVKIMSIHKSKGLEFPIVFLTDTSKLLNNQDTLKPLVTHTAFGVGAMYTDKKRRVEYPTLARKAIQKKLTDEMMAEELRLLYVAMTRAREKLIITMAYKDAQKAIDKLSLNLIGKIPPQILSETKSQAGWILLSALTRPESVALTEETYASKQTQKPGQWLMRVIHPGVSGKASGAANSKETVKHSAEDIEREFSLLRERFSFDYPYKNSVELPSKLTVTELKGRYVDYEAAEEAEWADALKEGKIIFDRPDFILDRTTPTGAERGTALHLALQYIDFKKCGSIEAVEEEIKRLSAKKLITPRQAQIADAAKIAALFKSDLGVRILSADVLEREFKFSLLTPAKIFYRDNGDDEILLQGVIDCFFEEKGGLIVVDFKTDRIFGGNTDKKVIQYAPQLNAYSDALERILKKPVKQRLIYFFETGECVEVK